jgi:hypothetical protein
MKITPTEREDLILYTQAILNPGRSFTNIEQGALYNLYNRIYGTRKIPNGCGACLRSTLAGLKKALEQVEGI